MLVKNPKKRLMIDYEMPNHPYFRWGVCLFYHSGCHQIVDSFTIFSNWPLLEARAVSAPWIPEYDICHVYEPTSPVFVPGPSNAEEDPYPTFAYVSPQAKRCVIYQECDDVDSESEYESEGVTTPTTPTTPDTQAIEEDKFAALAFAEKPPQ